MKLGKILGAILVVVAVAAVTAWFLRNTLIERFSGPFLEQYGLRITDISLRTIAGDGASVSYLELTHTNGTNVVLENLRLPLNVSSAALKVYAADRVVIRTAGRDTAEPFETSSWIDRLRELPMLLGDTQVAIGRLEFGDYDNIHELDWLLASDKQVLMATVDGVRMGLAITPTSHDSDSITVTLAQSSLGAELQRRNDAYAISGVAAIQVAEWLPFASLVNMAPEDLFVRSGSANTAFELRIPHEPAAALGMSASITVVEALLIESDSESGSLSLAVEGGSAPFEFASSFPQGSWRFSTEQASLVAGIADWRNVPVSVTGVQCESGIRCTFASKIAGIKVASPYGLIESLDLTTEQTVHFGESEISADISPNAKLRIAGLGGGTTRIGLLEATVGSQWGFSYGDSKQEARLPSLALRIDKLAIAGSVGQTLPQVSIDRMEMNSSQTLVSEEQAVRVDFSPDARILLRTVGGAIADFALLEATANSGSQVAISGDGWGSNVASLDLRIEKLGVGDTTVVTAPVFIENMTVASKASVLTAATSVFVPSTKISITDQTVTAPGFKGKVQINGAAMTATLVTAGIQREGDVSLRHNLDTAAGSATVRHAGISLDARGLADRVSPWPFDWSLNGGSIDADMDVSWSLRGSQAGIEASASLGLEKLAGYYTDIAFLGLSSDLDLRYDSEAGVTVSPSVVTVELVDIGFPLHNIRANYALQTEPLAADITNLGLEAFGGHITADPFSYRTGGEPNTLTLRAESVELRELLAVQEMEAINVSGSISAVLPVTIEGDKVTIDTGHLTGEAPGGVIQYRGGNVSAVADGSGVGLVTRALSNFRYDALTSDVSYSPEGDLKLQMRLTGRNPDMDETRPVILNLGVESNIPEMLRSLQAARSVEEVLQKRLQQ